MSVMESNHKYASRVRTAWWSKTFLAVAAVLSLVLLPFGFDVWDALIVAGVLTVTFFEFRVHSYFLSGDPRAPDLGFRNQACFAAAIMAYGIWHAVHPLPIPASVRSLLDQPTIDLIESTIKDGYLAIGLLGGLSQFGLACYYRSAKTPSHPTAA